MDSNQRLSKAANSIQIDKCSLKETFIWINSKPIFTFSRRAAKKQKRHSLAKIHGNPTKNGKKKRAPHTDVAVDIGAANGQAFANGAYTTSAHDDEYIDDFSDDEDDAANSKQPIPENIYENHGVVL